MVSKSQLGEDPNAPFRFEIGIALRGSLSGARLAKDLEASSSPGGLKGIQLAGRSKEIYKIRRHDGLPFDGQGFRLVRVTQESEDSSES